MAKKSYRDCPDSASDLNKQIRERCEKIDRLRKKVMENNYVYQWEQQGPGHRTLKVVNKDKKKTRGNRDSSDKKGKGVGFQTEGMNPFLIVFGLFIVGVFSTLSVEACFDYRSDRALYEGCAEVSDTGGELRECIRQVSENE